MQDDEAPGLFSSDPSVNPFYAFNKVYFQYCDGGSFSGTAGAVRMSQTTLYFAGHQILKQTIRELTSLYGFGSATEVLLSGCSAGGLATYLHADEVATLMPSSVVRFKAAPISGFFLDMSTLAGKPIYSSQMRNVFSMQNASVNLDCMNGSSDPSSCMFAEHVWPYLRTPILATNSMYDSWSLGNIFVPDNLTFWKSCIESNSSGCSPSQIRTLNAVWQSEFLSRILRPNTIYRHSQSQVPGGVFLDSIMSHCEAGFVWNELSINGQTVSSVWWSFFNDLQSSSRFIGCTLREQAPYFCADLKH